MVHALHFFQYRICEPAVGPFIVLPVGATKHRARVRNMTERPQPFVGKTVVVTFFFFLAQPHATQGVARIVGRNSQPIVLVHGLAVCVPASVCHPGSITSAQDGLQRRHQSTGRNDRLHTFALMFMDVRFPIGNYKQTALPQFAAQVHRQSFRSPESICSLAQLRLFLCRGTRRGETGGEVCHFVSQWTE